VYNLKNANMFRLKLTKKDSKWILYQKYTLYTLNGLKRKDKFLKLVESTRKKDCEKFVNFLKKFGSVEILD